MSQTATCTRCQHQWTGLAVAHCSACCRTVGGPAATFSSAGLFDKHRRPTGERGVCLNPGNVVNAAGEQVMFFRDGMWRGPEMTDEAKAARRSA